MDRGGGFAGRAAELARLRELVTDVARGLGGVLLVTGEQGIGKSALLAEGLAEAAELACRVGWAGGDELRAGYPLAVMADCLGSEGQAAVAGEGSGLAKAGVVWGGGDPVLAGAERLLAAVDRLCAVSPVVLVAEDLQWADEASVLVWRRLARAVRQLPLLLVGSFRPAPGQGGLGQLVGGVVAAGGVVAELRPLSAGEVARQAGGLLGGRPGRVLAGVLGQAGGNPLYVRELAGALVRSGRVQVAGGVAKLADGAGPVAVPGSLEALIGERLAGLPAAVVGVLRWAAVLGGEFSAAELALVTGRLAGDLAGLVSQAVAAGVVAGVAGERLAFRHGLIRRVLYEEIPGSVREALHLQAAQALAAAGAAAQTVAAQLAAAPTAAGGWARDWLAAHAGVLTYQAPQVAAQLLRQTLSQLPGDDPRREELEIALVRAASMLVRLEDAERFARPLLARATDPDRAAETAWLLARTLQRAGRSGDALAVLEDALAQPGASPVWQARLRSSQALRQWHAGQRDQAARSAEQALTQAGQAGDRIAAGVALHALSVIEHMRRNAAGCLDYIDRALAVIGDDPQTTDLRLILLANRESVLEDTDQMAEADATIREALGLAEQFGTPRLVLICTAAGDYYFQTGQWDEALTALETIADPSDDQPIAVMLHGQLALIAAHRDQWETAGKHLAAVQDQALDTMHEREAGYSLLLARAMAAERAGGPADAATVLGCCLDPDVAQDMPERHLLLPSLARAAMAAGDTATAAAAAQAAAHEAERDPLPTVAAAANWCRGLASVDLQPLLAAADYYQQAGRPLDQAQSLEDAAILLAGRGDLAGARQAFGRAARVYLQLGADWDLRRADARLRPHGIRRGHRGRPAAAATGWDALTPAEKKIAALVAQGQSNPDIAAELFLSRNTVQTHVSHILVKLGARSRAEIIRQALQHASGQAAS